MPIDAPDSRRGPCARHSGVSEMRIRCLLAIGLLAFSQAAFADPSMGTRVDQRCTALGWVPARPFNPNNVLSTDPNVVNCSLCHGAKPPKKSNVKPVGFAWLANKNDVSAFCQPPTQQNHAPQFAAVSPRQATVGQLLSFMVSATDQDNDAIALSVSNSPAGATFMDAGNGAGTFQWTPSASQSGSRTVTFHATDAGTPMASATLDVSISVGAANRAPVLAAIGNRQVNVNTALAITFSATDPDGNALSYAVQPLPMGATLNGAQFSWTPNANQVGNHPVTVSVTDNGSPAASDSEPIVITVGNANRPPQLAPIGNRTVDLGTTGRIALVATDPDQNVLVLACTGLPSGATLTDVGDGTGEIVWSPSAVGSSSVTCSATDNGLPAQSAQETFMLASRDPAATANAPVVGEAAWHTKGAKGWLRVSGDAPETEGASGANRNVEIFAMMAGAPVKLGQVRAHESGAFSASLPVFVAPCQVAASANGHLGAAVAVADAPADCDTTPLFQMKATGSCDGYSLRAKGRRAPPDATITATDAATGDALFSVVTTRGGSFRTRAQTAAFVHDLVVNVAAGGNTWTLSVPVNACK